MRKIINLSRIRAISFITLVTLALAACQTQTTPSPVPFQSLPYEKVDKPQVMDIDAFMEMKRLERERYMASLVQESFQRIDLLNNYIERNQDYINEYNRILLMKTPQ